MARRTVQVPLTHGNQLEEFSDNELVSRAKAGNGGAYAELCRRHSGMALRMIGRIVRNPEDTEDVLQESVLKAYRHLDGFDGRSKFSTWFTTISVNSALMLLRKRKSRPAQSLQDSRDELGDVVEFRDFTPSPESVVMRSQLLFQLERAVSKLPPVLRDVTEIRRSTDLSVEEISGIVGLSVAATKSRLLRARRMLSDTMVARPGRLERS